MRICLGALAHDDHGVQVGVGLFLLLFAYVVLSPWTTVDLDLAKLSYKPTPDHPIHFLDDDDVFL